MQKNQQPPPSNPYAKAAGAYDKNAQKHAVDQRELEARVLLKSTRMLQDLVNDWDSTNLEVIENTLKYNRNIWLMFYDAAMENADGNRPNDLRSNIINLANFIFKREVEIMTKPEKAKLQVLININQEIAAGLMVNSSQDTAEKAEVSPSNSSFKENI